MQSVLALFRGEVTLAERPEQDPDVNTSGDGGTTDAEVTAPNTTVPVVDPDVTTSTSSTTTTTPDSAPSTDDRAAVRSTPEVDADDIVFGIYPDPNQSCT